MGSQLQAEGQTRHECRTESVGNARVNRCVGPKEPANPELGRDGAATALLGDAEATGSDPGRKPSQLRLAESWAPIRQPSFEGLTTIRSRPRRRLSELADLYLY